MNWLPRIQLLMLLLATFIAQGQVFPVDTVIYNGPAQQKINFVFLADGYKDSELPAFIPLVVTVTDSLFNISPFKEYRSFFNVFAISVPSNESGASHPQTTADYQCKETPKDSVDNYFGSTFDFAGIHRLLIPTKQDRIASVLAASFPSYDHAFVIVNTPYYGGSGGNFPTGSTNEYSAEIAMHELGHSFGWLSDEYWVAGNPWEAPNMTQEKDPLKIKWRNWLGTNEVGIYQFTESKFWFRPHENCKMRTLNANFCSVCVESLTRKIHELVPPIEYFEPHSLSIDLAEEPVIFSIRTSPPQGHSYHTLWKKDGEVIAENIESLEVHKSDFNRRSTLLSVEVHDTLLTKLNPPFDESFNYVGWKILHPDLITSTAESVEPAYELRVYPNPITHHLNITYSLLTQSKVDIWLVDKTGKKLGTLMRDRQPAGTYHFRFTTSQLPNHAGISFLIVEIDGNRIVKKLIH